MNILITGGCGFVGTNVALFLKQTDPNNIVYCLDNLSRRGSELNLNRIKEKGCLFIHGDVRIATDFNRIPEEIDVIIDAAAEPSVLSGNSLNGGIENVIETNLMGTINTLYFASRNKSKLIFLSTSRIYPIQVLNSLDLNLVNHTFSYSENKRQIGVTINGINENFPIIGLKSLYGATKLSSELIIAEIAHNLCIPYVVNRCGVISGSYQMGKLDQGVVVLWLSAHIWKRELNYIGYEGLGYQSRDVLSVDDLSELIYWEINNFDKINGEVFNVGGGKSNLISLFQLTKKCELLTGNKLKINSVLEPRPNDIASYYTDNGKIFSFSNWKPKKNIDEILKDCFLWIKNEEDMLINILG